MKKLLIVALMILIMSCNKDEDKAKPAIELMTHRSWILSAHGYDTDDNRQIEPSENNIQPCEQDNNYAFNTNGTGVYSDMGLSCGGPDQNHFNWRLLNNDTQLEIGFNIISI